MATPTLEKLFDAGAHLGHRKDKTDPKVRPFVYRVQNRICLINLDKTLEKLDEALAYVSELSSKGKIILFVGTKSQIKSIIEESAKSVEMPYVINRWIGGTLTNFENIKRKIKELKKLEKEMAEKKLEGLTKKEKLNINKKIEQENKLFAGIKEIERLPDALLVFDTTKEKIAVAEAAKLKIPIIGINDMTYNEKAITKFVPMNDESRRAVELVASSFVGAIKKEKNKEKNNDKN